MYHRAVVVNVSKTEALDIEFKNLSYTVTPGFRKSKKQILRRVGGCFKSGELTAIMGPSGAGKSSLLNILTGFQRKGVTGDVQFRSNQGNHDWKRFKKDSCYIQQEDMLYPLFTVEEAMLMACNLKIGSSLIREAKQQVIDDVLDILDLSKTKKTSCDRLSGGERKRLSIALELVDNPAVMFLDEPTSGLDSSASVQCVTMLKNLARDGRTIVCIIHQPSAYIYEIFDHVYLLAEGRCMYQGDSKNTVNYFQKLGLNCPVYHNPADYIIEVVSKEYGDFNDSLAAAAIDCSWRISNKIKGTVQVSSDAARCNKNDKATVLITPPSEFSRFWILLNRCFIQLFRDWTVTYLKLAINIFVGFFLGITYLDFGWDATKSVHNVSFLIASMVYLSFTNMMPAILKFPSELPILRKEKFNNWYKLRTYYMAILLSNLPVQMIFVLTFASISYYITGQPPELYRFLMFVLVNFFVTIIAETLGLGFGTIFNPVNGTFVGSVVTCACLLFSGSLLLFNHMHWFMYYVSYFSYMRYASEAVVQAIYGYDRPNLVCSASENIEYCLYRMPITVLKELDMVENHYWRGIAVLSFQFVLIRFMVFFALKKKLSTL